MIKQLNNPVWSALTSGNKNLSIGNDMARLFQPGISPFAGVAENNLEHFQNLAKTLDPQSTVAIFTTDKDLDAAPLKIVNRIDGYQMMYEGVTPTEGTIVKIEQLEHKHVPDMLELTQLSPPGPFMERTISFGGYKGIFAGGRLIAMAGHRFHSGPYVEISAVCTHPDHTGKGYAQALINEHIRQLRSLNKIPYLHVRGDNSRAISIYKNMGFVVRTEMIIYILKML